MQNYVQKGQTLTVVAPYALLSGGGCQVGNIFGVTVNSQNMGDSSELVVEGVFDLAKDASTFNPGDKVFWNNTALQATSSPLTAAGVSNKEIGYAVLSQASGVNAPGGLTGDADRSRAAQSARLRSGAGGGHRPVADSENRGDAHGGADHGHVRSGGQHLASARGRTGTRGRPVHRADETRRHAVHRRRRGVVPVSRDRRGAALGHHPRRDRHQRGRERERACRRPRASSNRHRRPASTSSTPRVPSPPATARWS